MNSGLHFALPAYSASASVERVERSVTRREPGRQWRVALRFTRPTVRRCIAREALTLTTTADLRGLLADFRGRARARRGSAAGRRSAAAGPPSPSSA